MGVCSDSSYTDVHAAEAARKQAATPLLPHLMLFFFFFVLFIFSCTTLPLSALPFTVCYAFFFILPFTMLVILSLPPHLEDYSKIKGLKRNFEQSQPLMSLLD